MRVRTLFLIILLVGCTQTEEGDTAQQKPEEQVFPEPIIDSHLEVLPAYNPVLLYALTQEYIVNSGLRYGLFKLYFTATEDVEQVQIHARVPGYSEWTVHEIAVSEDIYEGFHNVDFNESVLEIMNTTPATLEYYFTYTSHSRPYESETQHKNLTLLGRRNNTWWYYEGWDQPWKQMEASWVTPTQPEIVELAETRMGLNNTSDYGAAYLLALEVYNNLFRERILYVANEVARKLPAEVLWENSGDCDEMSGLYASVLEALGIETKKVNIPGHQYMLIKLGEYWKGFDPTVRDYWGSRVLSDFQFSLELGEEQYRDRDENTTVYSPREEWAKGLRKVVLP